MTSPLRRVRRAACLALIIASVAGCSSARTKDREADRLFASGQYYEASEHLKKGLVKEGEGGRDRLLYLLDLGLALHAAGKYDESSKIFLEADRLAEIKDYTSLAAETATAFVSENLKPYKAEDFENVLISVYLALDYTALGMSEDALVEARRVNRKLYLMVSEGKRKYKQNAFAHYLSGILHESIGEADNAYIDYKRVHGLMPAYPGLGRDLWRLATQLHIREDQERWKKEFALDDAALEQAKKSLPKAKNGELIVLFQNGISPIKQPNPDWHVLPKFYPRANPVTRAEVKADGASLGETAVLEDIEATAIQNLDEKYGALVAKKIAGLVGKEVVATVVENQTKSPLIGLLTRVALQVADQADLRSWNLLPKDLQAARFALPPGEHEIEVTPVESKGDALKRNVRIEPGKKAFLIVRYQPKFAE